MKWVTLVVVALVACSPTEPPPYFVGHYELVLTAGSTPEQANLTGELDINTDRTWWERHGNSTCLGDWREAGDGKLLFTFTFTPGEPNCQYFGTGPFDVLVRADTVRRYYGGWRTEDDSNVFVRSP